VAIPKRVRFEVFKRDSFTCQYCGQKAPDVILQVDHIEPRSLDGSDDIINLVTSCDSCNLGKSNIRLSDETAINKQRSQLDRLQERREQLEMMMSWQRGLVTIEADETEEAARFWADYVPPFRVTDIGKADLRKLIRRFGLAEVIEAMKIAATHYPEYDQEGNLTASSIETAWRKIGGICVVRKRERDNPVSKDLYYIRGILRKRVYVNERQVMDILQNAFDAGVRPEDMKRAAAICPSWTQFLVALDELIGVED
jgi:hypothetical protein